MVVPEKILMKKIKKREKVKKQLNAQKKNKIQNVEEPAEIEIQRKKFENEKWQTFNREFDLMN